MAQALITIAGLSFSTGEVLAGCAALALLLIAVGMVRSARGRSAEITAAEQARELDRRLAELTHLQAEMTGRMQTMAEVFGSRQADLARAVSERLDGLSHRIGHSMVETTRSTQESLSRLHERIGVIDRAQRTIHDLSGQVGKLQSILSDKQSRGAFGQGRMEAIVADALPPNAYSFQATLSSGVRPDCLIHMPGGGPPLAIDAKFPLEAWTALGASDGDEARKQAALRFRRDMLRHVIDIRDKYLVPGETQDTAFLFVPSESIFADLHERFDDVVQKAQRARVVIVSPSLLVLSIQVVQGLLRDQRMREQADLIQSEVVHLLDDLDRLHDRVMKLQAHHAQVGRDLEQIATTSDKLRRRGDRIENLDLDRPLDSGGALPAPIGLNRMAGE